MTRAAWESPPDSAFSGPALGCRSALRLVSKLMWQTTEAINSKMFVLQL